ncbi:unannotated protein [freshwater metagenome]|uniref:Unannotated protein n=1 Tax=freshwater metagenome TaxID=449393 RepID=A0A6J6VIC2_9ZZZZ|nr:hypothetical protein [Actinomycetota bacterium]
MTQEQGSPEGGTSGAPSSRGFRVGLLLALVLVLVGSLAWTGYLVATRTSGAGGNLPERVGSLLSGENTIAAERERVMDVASQFMLRVNSYGPDDLAEDGTMPDYRERVGELITPAFRADFETQVGTAEQTVAQAQLGRECEVYGVGVSTMDADSATALVAGVFTNSYPGNGRRADERVESEPAPFRVRISLVKMAGEWLVDDFAPVTGAGVSLDPSAAPGDPVDPAVPPTDEAPEEQQ